MMDFTVKQLAGLAGISVRTLHYYDEIGLLKPCSHSPSGYRLYSQADLLTLQQVLFFKELGFDLHEIKRILTSPGFNVIEALQSHQKLLSRQVERTLELIKTVEYTIQQLQGERTMEIKEYYHGFSDDQINKYRREVKERWGEKTLQDSEDRILKMGKNKFSELQEDGNRIFQSIADNMALGFNSPEVQNLVARWRRWLENFSHYSPEAVLGLGMLYSQDPEFSGFFRKINPALPQFFTQAVEYYCAHNRL